MQIGLHVSISGSVANAVTNAIERECSAFQIFTGNPRGWYSKDLSNEDVSNYKKNLSECDIDRFATVAHMPYLPNLSTPDIPGYEKSIKAMIREVERCAKIGIPYLVTHLGSHKGSGEENGMQRLTSALMEVAKATKDVTILCRNFSARRASARENLLISVLSPLSFSSTIAIKNENTFSGRLVSFSLGSSSSV